MLSLFLCYTFNRGVYMKKFLFIFILLIPLIVSAKSYTIKDMTVSFDNDWTVFTRDNIDNNQELKDIGLTTEYMEDLFNKNDIYIDAVIFNKENPSDTIEMLYAIKSTDLERNLHKYSEKELKELESEMIKDYKVSEHGIHNTGKYKYVYMMYKDNGLYVYDYYTVINGYGYTIKLQKVNKFTNEELKEFKQQINSIYYKIDPEYEKSPHTFNWGSVAIYAVIGAVVGGIGALIKKKQTNA